MLVRLDGLYGNAAPLTTVVNADLDVITRSKDYALLDREAVRVRLAHPADLECTHPESGAEREGEHALVERRHGHTIKLRGEVLTFVLDYCQNHASAASREIQRLVAERFNLGVSISQLNRVRATHELSRKNPLREKKPEIDIAIASGYYEQAGGLLLLAAAAETGLLIQLEQALPTTPTPACLPLAGSTAVRRRLLLTLLFLGAVGLRRTWDLRGYTADGLALLTGRTHAYGYQYTEAFLSQVACADGAERFTNTLGSWATHLWHPVETAAEAEHPHHLQVLTLLS